MIPEIETKSLQEIQQFQAQKLQEALVYLKENSPFYKEMFIKHSINISQIKSVSDLQKIPVTSKTDLQLHNQDFFCVPKSKIIDYSTTSGTLGTPVTFGLTDRDLDRLAYNEAISFACAGIKAGDVVQLMTTMDRRFMAGMAYFMGLRKLGAGIIRVGAGIPELQWDSILNYKPQYIIAVPSFLIKLIEYAENKGIDYNSSSIKAAICIGEPLRDQYFKENKLASKITSKWKIKLFSTYASTEMSTAFTECKMQQGGHLHPELIITEVLNDNNEPAQIGEHGELTITTLGIEAMPLLRFKTGDIVKVFNDPCPCGRNTVRIGPVVGRKQQMIKYKGTTIYPPAIHDLISTFDNILSHVVEVHTNDLGNDELIVKVALKNPDKDNLSLIEEHFRAKLRVVPMIETIDTEALHKIIHNPMSRKPINFVDNRVK